MTDMSKKWNSDQITIFLQIYKSYDVLWNTKDKKYLSKNLRSNAMDQFRADLYDAGLIVDDIQLKLKIKCIRDSYRQELIKLMQSKKSGATGDAVYTPKLVWFNLAHSFLADVLTRRSNVVRSVGSSEGDNGETDYKDFQDQDITCDYEVEEWYDPSPQPDPPDTLVETSQVLKKSKKRKKSINSATLDAFDAIIDPVGTDDSCERFGLYIGAQLRELPLRQRVMAQQEIQNVMVKSILTVIDDENEFGDNSKRMK